MIAKSSVITDTLELIYFVQSMPAEYVEHRSTYTLSLKDVDLWKDLSNEEIAYWIERSPSSVQHSCGPFSTSKRVFKKQSRFCTKALFYSTKVNGETKMK